MVPDSQNGLMKSLKRQLFDTRVYINSTALVLPQKKKRKTNTKQTETAKYCMLSMEKIHLHVNTTRNLHVEVTEFNIRCKPSEQKASIERLRGLYFRTASYLMVNDAV